MLSPLLAQGDDGSFSGFLRDPAFLQWLVYAYVGYQLYLKVAERFERKKEQKDGQNVNLKQPLEIRHASEPADKSEVAAQFGDLKLALINVEARLNKKLNDSIDNENALHLERIKAGQHRVQDLSEVVEVSASRLEAQLKDALVEMRRGRGELHEKCNKVTILAETNATDLKHVNNDLSRLNGDIGGCHRRIDDVVKGKK
ncbi:MAG: hypothetical protein U0984_15785 [Prosthecobacter sp.]|nr:hypothetical protein [Prosthecobacter sp.]